MGQITYIKTLIIDAVKYPATDWMKVIILGFLFLLSLIGIITQFNLLTLISLILLPIPLGYLLQIIKNSFIGNDSLPTFQKWKEMYKDGLNVLITIIIYALPVVAVFIINNQGQILLPDFSNNALYSVLTFILGSVYQIIVLFIIGLFEIIGLANMALYNGELSAAFRFREIIRRISMIGWGKYILYYLIIWIILALIVILSSLTLLVLIGILLVPLLIAPYFLIVNTRFLALIFASSED